MVDKGKRVKLAERSEDDGNYPGQIDADLELSMEMIQEIQDHLDKINEEASDKVLEVERKYNQIRKPAYDKRSEIIKSIPDFWLIAFSSHPALGKLLAEEDQEIFKHLISLHVEDFKDVKSGYSITFNFEPNPYFEDTTLVKSFTFLDEGPTKITATSIKWKEGMGIPNGVNHDKKGNKRPFSNNSFFSWFSDIQQKDDTEEIHDEIAEIIKEDLWPNPLNYFITEADEEDFDDEEAYGEGKDGDDSNEDEDDEDEDPEEDDKHEK